MKTNKDRVLEVLVKKDLVLGCWDVQMEQLTLKSLKLVLENVGYGGTDIKVPLKRKPHVVQIDEVDNEVDFSIISKAEYIDRYGDEFFDEE